MSFSTDILLDPATWEHVDVNRLSMQKNTDRYHDLRTIAAKQIRDYIVAPDLYTDCPNVLKSATEIGELSLFTKGLKVGMMAVYSEASIIAPKPDTYIRQIPPDDIVTNATWLAVLVSRVATAELPQITSWYGSKHERMKEVLTNSSRGTSGRQRRISSVGVIGPEIVFGTWGQVSKIGTPMLYLRHPDKVLQKR